jgi:hypothetical protein
VLTYLLKTETKQEKRGKWWVRLCIDLKHLKLKKECLRVAEYALLECNWVQSGTKSSLFRIKEQLQNIKKPKSKKKKGKKKND